MKKIVTILILSIVFCACSSDDNSNNNLCSAPTALDANAISSNSARLSWLIPNGLQADLHEVEYGMLGFALGTGTSATIPVQEYFALDLMPTTEYSFYSRVFCESTNAFSNWAGPYAFVTIDNNPNCEEPHDFQLATTGNPIGVNYIDIRWSINIAPESYDIEYGLQGFSLGSGATQIATGNQVRIENLNSQTTYDFYIRSNCGNNGRGDWVGPITETTF